MLGAALAMAVINGAGAGAQRVSRTPTAVAAAEQRTASPTIAANTTCLACHGMANLVDRDSLGKLRRFAVDARAFRRSVHGHLTCLQCHAGTTAYPHDSAGATARTTCGGDCHATDASGRPYTHRREAEELRGSVHGPAAGRDGATCLTCHGGGDPHAVARTRDAAPAVRMAACVRCHADSAMAARHHLPVDVVDSYERSFHYKAIRFGDASTAACSDCHTAHHVLARTDPRSTIATANLTRTCGRSGCHEGARLNFASSGANHLDLRVSREPVLWVEQWFFRVLTTGTLAMLLVGIALDVQKKFGWSTLVRRGNRAAVLGVVRLLDTISLQLGRLYAVLATSRRAALRAVRLILYD